MKPLDNILDNIKKYIINRCIFLSVNYGCIISWLTFATLCPEMTNESCCLKINMNGPLYKSINWDYVNNKKSLETQLKIFYKYYMNSKQIPTSTPAHVHVFNYNGYKLQISYV